MKIKIEISSKKVPEKVPESKRIIVVYSNSNYSKPHLNIPKDGGYWYVSYWYRNPETGVKEKFVLKKGLNRIKDRKERKKHGKALVQAIEELLRQGFNPFTKEGIPIEIEDAQQHFTLATALDYAFENKKSEWKESTLYDIESRKNVFLAYAESKQWHCLSINDIVKKHIVTFLNHQAKSLSSKSVNNYRAAISSLFGKLANDDIIPYNFVKDIGKRKERPSRHKAFTAKQIEALRTTLKKNDPQLYLYLKMVGMTFLRPREVIRLQVKDIDLENKLLYVETKTETQSTVRIIDTLIDDLKALELEKYKPTDFLFTPARKPGVYTAKEGNKVTFFSKQFAEYRNELNFGMEHTIYSMRHTFAIDLYKNFIRKGKTDREAVLAMLPITRHKSETGLRNYLRNIGATVAKDYSDAYTLEF
ncbi:tyrosine-type recombinase/integrase [Flavobacteriaceae bacterium M23B6Z8]